MLMMGAVYLSYSSYFVSFGMENIKTLIGASINMLYAVLFYITYKNNITQNEALRQHLIIMGGD